MFANETHQTKWFAQAAAIAGNGRAKWRFESSVCGHVVRGGLASLVCTRITSGAIIGGPNVTATFRHVYWAGRTKSCTFSIHVSFASTKSVGAATNRFGHLDERRLESSTLAGT
mmetsp:Transcript_107877/g.302085  ORF Transcript_107877/g.302085 Transcript_107877/m.302085 type:complete len:114 (-) Transcript_107877:679-1020(-)